MATTKTIGTGVGRDYPDIASWLVDFAPGGWIGVCENDSLFTAGCNFSGQSTSITDYIRLECAAGQSFRDGGASQALTYDASKGVAIDQNVPYASVFTVNELYVTLFGLQIKNSSNYGAVENNTQFNTSVIDSCILVNTSASGISTIRWRYGIVVNSLVIYQGGASHGAVELDYAVSTFVNCTIVNPSNVTAGNYGFPGGGSAASYNNAVFGFGGFNQSTMTGSNNGSDKTIGFGTSNQASLTYTSQFVGTTTTSSDFRLQSGSALGAGAGADQTAYNGGVDIYGTARPTGLSSIGCFQPTSGPTVISGAGTMAGAATVAGVGKTLRRTAGSIVGAATVAGVGKTQRRTVGTIQGVSNLNAVGLTLRKTAGSCAGAASLVGVGMTVRMSAGTIAGSSSLAGVFHATGHMVGTCAGAATVNGVGKTFRKTAGSITGSSSLSGATTNNVTRPTAGTIMAIATLTGIFRARGAMAGAIAGAAILAGVARVIAPSNGTIAGSSSLSGATKVFHTSAGTCAGAATVNGVAHARIASAGTMAGVATLNGATTNNVTRTTAGTIAGQATLAGVGHARMMAAGTIAGSSSLAGVTHPIATAAGHAAGAASLSGTTAAHKAVAGTIQGSSSLIGIASGGVAHTAGHIVGAASLVGMTIAPLPAPCDILEGPGGCYLLRGQGCGVTQAIGDFPSFNPTERKPVGFDFTSELRPGDSVTEILTFDCKVAVNPGADPTPATKLILPPTLFGNKVTREVGAADPAVANGFQPMVEYYIASTVLTRLGDVLTLWGFLKGVPIGC
jgi:hypothetical protein